MINDKAYEVIEKLFQSSLSRYQIGFEKSGKGSDFVFDCLFYFTTNVIKKSELWWIIYRLSQMDKHNKTTIK